MFPIGNKWQPFRITTSVWILAILFFKLQKHCAYIWIYRWHEVLIIWVLYRNFDQNWVHVLFALAYTCNDLNMISTQQYSSISVLYIYMVSQIRTQPRQRMLTRTAINAHISTREIIVCQNVFKSILFHIHLNERFIIEVPHYRFTIELFYRLGVLYYRKARPKHHDASLYSLHVSDLYIRLVFVFEIYWDVAC